MQSAPATVDFRGVGLNSAIGVAPAVIAAVPVTALLLVYLAGH